MFASRYFCDRYFAPRYFPKLGGVLAALAFRRSLFRRLGGRGQDGR